MSIRVYVEGGAPGALNSSCRKAFSRFFGNVIPENSFKVIACGSRSRTFDMFRTALDLHKEDQVLLLVDAEEDVNMDVWAHLLQRAGDGWLRPDSVTDEQAHLMAQVMESWFLSDPEMLATYFGKGFRQNALPRRKDIERVSKLDVYHALDEAAKLTTKKGYQKSRDSFTLLENVRPQLLRVVAPHAERLFAVLERKVFRVSD